MQGWCIHLFLTYSLILLVTLFLALLCSWQLSALLPLPPPLLLLLSSRMPLRQLYHCLLPPLLLPTCRLTVYLWVLGVRVSSPLIPPLAIPALLFHLLLALLLPLPRPLHLLLSPLLLLLLLPGLPFMPLPLFLPLHLSRVLRVYRGWGWVIPCLLGFPLVHHIDPLIPRIPLLLWPTGLPLPRPLMTRMTLLTRCRVMMTLWILMRAILLSTLRLLLFPLTRIALNIVACLSTYAVCFRKLLVPLLSILHRSLSLNRSLRLLLSPNRCLPLTGLSGCGKLLWMRIPS